MYAIRTPRTSKIIEAVDWVLKRFIPEGELELKAYTGLEDIKKWVQPVLTGVDFMKLCKSSLMDSGEIRLPFDTTAFEFEMLFGHGGHIHHIAAFRNTDDGVLSYVGLQEFEGSHWVVTGGKVDLGMEEIRVLDPWIFRKLNAWFPITDQKDVIAYQSEATHLAMHTAKATCVLLDSGVAEMQTEQPPRWHRKLVERAGGSELKDFHKLYIRKQRSTYEPKGGTHASPRAHFRRGHWRHLSEIKKTWIRWTMVGDLDLGFIDKAYVVK